MKDIWKKIWDMIKGWFTKDDPDPVPPDPPGPDPVYNDTTIRLSIRHAGNEIQNDGTVTYLKGILTTKVANGWRPCAVQWNDKTALPGQGERTCWKDMNNNTDHTDPIPADKADLIVAWFEK